MKKFGILWLLILFFSIDSSAQKTKTKKKAKDESGGIFISEIMPEFPGGEDSFMKFIKDSFRLTNIKFEQNEEIPATIYLQFIVTKTGKSKYSKISKSNNSSLINECKRLTSIMPRWKPARAFNGKKIDCNFEVPIKIHIE